MHARQVLYKLSYISKPRESTFWGLVWFWQKTENRFNECCFSSSLSAKMSEAKCYFVTSMSIESKVSMAHFMHIAHKIQSKTVFGHEVSKRK